MTQAHYRHEIDGLRAFAVIAVVINHFNNQILPGGYLGVDIFFVISGYVITSSLWQRDASSLKDLLLFFYARRIKRLLPALFACIILTALVGFLFIPPTSLEFKPSYETGVSALLGLSNVYLMQTSSAYFAPNTQLNLFTQTWSLSVEAQFYLVFPLLLWVGRRQNLKFWLSGLTILSLAAFCWLNYIHHIAAYFHIAARFWEIAAGSLAFLSQSAASHYRSGRKSSIALISMLGLASMLFLPESLQPMATFAVVLFTACLIMTVDQASPLYSVLTSRPARLIGVASYSIYLWHWSVLTLSRWTIGIDWWTVPFQVLAIVLLAGFSYYLIENPLRHQAWLKSPGKTIFAGIMSIAIGATTLVKLGTDFRGRLYQGNVVNPHGTWWISKDGILIEKCHFKTKYSEAVFNDCIQPSPPGKPSIYLFGDSHARNYLKGIQAAFSSMPVDYATMSWGCAFMPEKTVTETIDRQYRCTDYVMAVQKFASQSLIPGDVVIVGQHRRHQQNDLYGAMIIDLANTVVKRGGKFILVADTPGLGVELMTCLKQPWRQFQPASCSKTLDQVKIEQQQLDAIGRQLELAVPGAKYLDIRDAFCVANVCSAYGSAYGKDMILYHDTDHITDEASSAIADRLAAELSSTITSTTAPHP
jgi:peptidoglycan/LPS O-acetylase OafA/YrhL